MLNKLKKLFLSITLIVVITPGHVYAYNSENPCDTPDIVVIIKEDGMDSQKNELFCDSHEKTTRSLVSDPAYKKDGN